LLRITGNGRIRDHGFVQTRGTRDKGNRQRVRQGSSCLPRQKEMSGYIDFRRGERKGGTAFVKGNI